MEQERVKRYTRPTEESKQYEYAAKDAVREQEIARRAQNTAREAGELAVEHSEALLDEIDEILEVNAEQVVSLFRQAGGQ